MRRAGLWVAGALGAALALSAGAARAEEAFSYNPPGMLVSGSGDGRYDEKVYAPGMRFPIEEGPAFLNSQVWGHGGSEGPGGGQCDPENRQFPWWDNYCEKRTWDMPLCPAGTGHQGQDIRAGDCQKDVHWVVAAADGTITSIGSYSVYLTTEDGTRFDYLHMSNVQVAVGQVVLRGDKLGKVSNEFGGTPTTIHLHFNIRQNVEGVGIVYVPPYLSLVASYEELINTAATGEVASATCERVRAPRSIRTRRTRRGSRGCGRGRARMTRRRSSSR
ncbi:MAG: M23 family metallopeptidase [Polyangiaceae bacterium]